MIGRLEAPGAKVEPVMPGLENRRSPSWARALAADLLVRHHGDGGELIGDDRKHALLRRGSSRRWLRLWRALAIAAGSRTGDAHGRAGRNDGPVPLTIGLGAVTVMSGSCVDGGRILGHRAVADGA